MHPLLANDNFILDPIVPLPVVLLLGAVLAALTIYLYARIGARLATGKNVVLLVFRLLGLALLLLLLLQPSQLELIPPPKQDRVTLVALDTSLSMKQVDAERATRLDAAKNLLLEADICTRGGEVKDARTRLFEFNEDASALTQPLFNVAPKGKTTRFHKSITTMLNSVSGGESARALLLLTDGHDFELVNPVATGSAARVRLTPIYAVPLGKQGKVRDVATRITSYQPYCYVKQKAHIGAALRLIGCEFEDLQIQLLRQNQVVQTRHLNAGEFQDLPVEFEVTEPEVGQYEYEIKVLPLPGESDLANNSALTYLNVIDQQIQVLMLEGSPYWDTTFLQRSLLRNDKFDVDSLVQYADKKIRPIRKHEVTTALQLPATADQFRHYDVIILGRAVDQMLTGQQLQLLTEYVREGGGTVIFSRGRAFASETASELEPVLWSDATQGRVHLQAVGEGASAAPFRALNDSANGTENLPDLLTARDATERKPLTATFALALPSDGGTALPGMVQRRFGQGQVVSIGVEGLWRWALNSRVSGPSSAFDRFWDQMILWLLANRDFVPNRQFSLRANSGNIQLGEKIFFRLIMRNLDRTVKNVPLRFFYAEKEIARATMSAGNPEDPTRLTADYLPEKTGKYRVVANFPDGTSQESRFIVFTENLEETEVTTDVGYLKRLCDSSGGRVIAPAEMAKLLAEYRNETVDLTPKRKVTTVWDTTWVCYLLALCLGADWYLRRRWGLS